MKKLVLAVLLSAAVSSGATACITSFVTTKGQTVATKEAVNTKKDIEETEKETKEKDIKETEDSLTLLNGKLTDLTKSAQKATTRKGAKGLKGLDNTNVYDWVDGFTGVHYLIYSRIVDEAGMGGITPRLNADLSIMTDTYAIAKK